MDGAGGAGDGAGGRHRAHTAAGAAAPRLARLRARECDPAAGGRPRHALCGHHRHWPISVVRAALRPADPRHGAGQHADQHQSGAADPERGGGTRAQRHRRAHCAGCHAPAGLFRPAAPIAADGHHASAEHHGRCRCRHAARHDGRADSRRRRPRRSRQVSDHDHVRAGGRLRSRGLRGRTRQCVPDDRRPAPAASGPADARRAQNRSGNGFRTSSAVRKPRPRYASPGRKPRAPRRDGMASR